MEALEGLDAAFLALERGNAHFHIAAVLVLDRPEEEGSGGPPDARYAQIRQMVEQRIHLVPRLRQRAVRVPLGLYHPVWVDDPGFELDDHVRRASVPAPGGSRQLDDLVADLMSQPLDPDRPLWEMVVVEGLAGGRTALVAKLHHAVLDGTSGASLLAAFFDLGPGARPVPPPAEPWDPEPLPSPGALLRYATASLAHQPEAVAGAFRRGVDALVGVAGHQRRLAGQGAVPPPPPFSAPRTSLGGSLSSRRAYATVAVPVADVALVQGAYGVTRNDVLLAGVAGALRRLLASRGETPDRPLVALVPVSTRPEVAGEGAAGGGAAGEGAAGPAAGAGSGSVAGESAAGPAAGAGSGSVAGEGAAGPEAGAGSGSVAGEGAAGPEAAGKRASAGTESAGGGAAGGGAAGAEIFTLGNRISSMLVSLATDVDDPVLRLQAIARSTEVAKAQEKLAGGRLLADVAQVAPPALVSRAVRWASGLGLFERLPPLCNVAVSSVPGLDVALWCAGSRVVALHPVGPVAEGAALNVTSMTYQGTVYFGLLGCRKLVPDVADLAVLLGEALGELVAAALDARGPAG